MGEEEVVYELKDYAKVRAEEEGHENYMLV
jgi:hypothetical protein